MNEAFTDLAIQILNNFTFYEGLIYSIMQLISNNKQKDNLLKKFHPSVLSSHVRELASQ